MVFWGRKGELLVVIGYGINSLDDAKQVSNVTRMRDKRNSLCQLPGNTSW